LVGRNILFLFGSVSFELSAGDMGNKNILFLIGSLFCLLNFIYLINKKDV
jgi:hypothetical protein